MADNNPPELPPDPWKSKDGTDPAELREDTDKFLEALPPNLQATLLSFFRELSKNVVAQHTRVSEGNISKISVSSDHEKFYKTRLKEVNESGFLNPHVNPPKTIT